MAILSILFLVLFIYLAISVAYAFVFSLAGRIGSLKKFPGTSDLRRYAVMIPCYKEDKIILETARQALNQTYPSSHYEVVVIADSLKPATIEILKAMPLKVVEVAFDVSTKAKSINKALSELPEIYDYALILDADNVMARDFIEKINSAIVHTDVKAIQGHRVAKNLNTSFAILDAISEEINNHIYRKGHRILGLSSGLIGSGMAFEYNYFKKVMATNHAIGGFDKELELKLLKDKIKIEYVNDALVFDEKVENSTVFGNQRRRWISAQVFYFRKYFFSGLWHLLTRGNINFFDKAFQQFLLPRVLLLGSLIFMSAASCIIEFGYSSVLLPGVNWWLGALFVNVTGLLLAIPDSFYNKRSLIAAIALPKAIVVMFLTLFKLKGANKKFIHTPHSGTMSAEVLPEKTNP